MILFAMILVARKVRDFSGSREPLHVHLASLRENMLEITKVFVSQEIV